MSGFFGGELKAIRPRAARRPPIFSVLIVFLLAVVAVWRLGATRLPAVDSRPSYTATAYVVHSANSGSGPARIPLAYTDVDPERAERAANSLAWSYAEDRLAEWRQGIESARRKANRQTQTAERAYQQAVDQLDALRRQLAAQIAPPSPPPTPMIDNPRWLELKRRIETLQRQRDDLLVARTPLHPAVRDVSDRIALLQRQLAELPRQVAVQQPTQPLPTGPANSITANQQQQLDDLSAAVQQADKKLAHCRRVEQFFAQADQNRPAWSVEQARLAVLPPAADDSWGQLLATALAAAVAMALGTGAVATAANIDPPIVDVQDVQRLTGTTVLASLPVEDEMVVSAEAGRRQIYRRRALICLGMLLLATGPTLAAWGISGI